MLNTVTTSIYVHAIVSSLSEAISGFEPAAVTVKFQARARVSEIKKLASVIEPFHPTTFLPVCVIHDLPLKPHKNFNNKHLRPSSINLSLIQCHDTLRVSFAAKHHFIFK